jgi:hypothetical protein
MAVDQDVQNRLWALILKGQEAIRALKEKQDFTDQPDAESLYFEWRLASLSFCEGSLWDGQSLFQNPI